ncbi:protein MEI2-like 7 [Oryza brachyantha]|uniref:protein MEI2-like 7 n=1 Tax=Oryza brachyantha TaxID=4533 RepID=UPI001ADB95C4|nr:protein MEI2-like 7 [Oryza brachyantha]
MAVTKLNPSAPPFQCSRRPPVLAPAPPPPPPLYHAAAGACTGSPFFPFYATYSCASFPFHGHLYPPCGYPAQMGPPPSGTLFAKGAAVAAAPAAAPHGRPPHKLMLCKGAPTVTDEKLRAQAQAAAKAAAVQAWRPAPATIATGAPPRMLVAAAPCGMLHPAVGKEHRPRKQRSGRERSPSPAFTTGPVSPLPPMQELKRSQTTVMVRNIPNKLTRTDMVRLLDDHCARANRRRGSGEPRAEYDLVYVRMDFGMCSEQRSSNMGYAFVNFTTAEAARGLQRALHGCRWKRPAFDSGKVIDIRAARIQGKVALVRHFGRTTYYECGTDEYLPAVFSPPRDGSAAAGEAQTVGIRVPPATLPRHGN